MSLSVLTAIWGDPPCKAGELLCLLAIADNADESGYGWPSMETIARKAAMSERGARKCIRKLEESGLISVEIGGGRGGSSGYQITTNGIGYAPEHKNPEQHSGNGVPPLGGETGNSVPPLEGQNPEQRDINPEQRDTKPGTPVPPNRKEPSIEQLGRTKTKKMTAQLSLLCEFASKASAESFIEYRKRQKWDFSEVAAKRLRNTLEAIVRRGGSADDALGMAEERNWRSIEAEWYFNAAAVQRPLDVGQDARIKRWQSTGVTQ